MTTGVLYCHAPPFFSGISSYPTSIGSSSFGSIMSHIPQTSVSSSPHFFLIVCILQTTASLGFPCILCFSSSKGKMVSTRLVAHQRSSCLLNLVIISLICLSAFQGFRKWRYLGNERTKQELPKALLTMQWYAVNNRYDRNV